MQSAQWHGQCPGCEAWNTLVEERCRAARRSARGARRARGGARRLAHGRARRPTLAARRCARSARRRWQRLSTGIGELDRVLGGGLVPGSLVLLGGSPGIGKSTLTNMALGTPAGAGRAHAVRQRRGVGRAGPAARRAPRPATAALAACRSLAETDLDTVLDDDRRRAARRCA